MYPTEFLNSSDLKIRKYWLVLLVFFLATALIVSFFPLSLGDPTAKRSTIGIFGSFMATCMVALIVGTMYYLLYYSAYKNPGTKLLLIQIIFIAIAPITQFFDVEKEGLFSAKNDLNQAYSTFLWIYFISNTILSYWWAFLCIKLRKINKKIQHSMLYDSAEYAHACTSLTQAQTVDALDVSLQKAVQNRSKKFVSAVKKLYKTRKEALEKEVTACTIN